MVVVLTNYDPKIAAIEGKTPDVSNLVTKTSLTTVENKIPDVTNLATKTALTAIENKIPDASKFAVKIALTNISNAVPDISTLIKKSDYDTKIAEIENKYVSNTGFDSKLAQTNVITKRNFDAKIIEIENNIKTLQTFGSSYFRGKSHFEKDDMQNDLIFQPLYWYFKMISNSHYVSGWKSKGLSDESIKAPTTSDNSLNPKLSYYLNSKIKVQFNGSTLRQPKTTYNHNNTVNIYIVYELAASGSNVNYPILKNCLFGAVTLTINVDIDRYGYSGDGNGFDRKTSFSFPGVGFGQNALIFGVEMSFSAHIDNKKK